MPLGPIAQSVEQRTFNPWVDGSSPSGPTFLIAGPINLANVRGFLMSRVAIGM